MFLADFICTLIANMLAQVLVLGGLVLARVISSPPAVALMEFFSVEFEKFVVRFGLILVIAYLTINFVVVPAGRLTWRCFMFALEATRVAILMFWRLTLFLSSPVRVLYANHRLRRKVMHVTRAKSMTQVALTGQLRFDVNGPYILILVNGSERQVRIGESDLACLSYSSAATNRGAEALLPGAVMVPSPPAKGQVFFRVGKLIVGSGFRTSHFGGDFLVTACHVARSLADTGADFAICRDELEVVMTKELRDLMQVQKWSVGLDYMVFKIPTHVFSVLGVKSMKLAKTPIGPSVSAYGVSSGDMVKSFGVVSKATDMFQFRHSVSTEKGWSGSPLCNEAGAVIGMHVRGFGKAPVGYSGNWAPHNVGVSFDWSFVPKNYESDTNIYAFNHVEEWELDSEDDRRIVLHEIDADRELDARGNTYSNWNSTSIDAMRNITFNTFSWADEMDEQDFNSSLFESVFPICPPTGAVKLVDTNEQQQPGSVTPTASSSPSSGLTPDVEVPSVDPPATLPKKSRRKSRNSKGGDGPKHRGKESNVPSTSTPAGISSEPPTVPAILTPPASLPSVTTTRVPQPGSNALSKELCSQLALLVPLAATMSPPALRKMVASLPSGEENLQVAMKWLSERTQRNAARATKKSVAASARS